MPPPIRASWVARARCLQSATCIFFFVYFLRKFGSVSDDELTRTDSDQVVGLKQVPPSFKTWCGTDQHQATLVLYVFAHTDSRSRGNLKFFLEEALRVSACFVVIMQQRVSQVDTECSLHRQFSVPPFLETFDIPFNVWVIPHNNVCYDLGTIGWFLNCSFIPWNDFKYFFIINSSVRGPFIPSLYPDIDWLSHFRARISGKTKLVGCTVNCEFFPHVQSYAFMTDIIGIQLLLHSRALACHENRSAAISDGELGISRVIRRNGYDFKALLHTQDIDWHENGGAYCSSHRHNPTAHYSGVQFNSFDVVFVKFHDELPGGAPYTGQLYAEMCIGERRQSRML